MLLDLIKLVLKRHEAAATRVKRDPSFAFDVCRTSKVKVCKQQQP